MQTGSMNAECLTHQAPGAVPHHCPANSAARDDTQASAADWKLNSADSIDSIIGSDARLHLTTLPVENQTALSEPLARVLEPGEIP